MPPALLIVVNAATPSTALPDSPNPTAVSLVREALIVSGLQPCDAETKSVETPRHDAQFVAPP
jgi:hypothetical protein